MRKRTGKFEKIEDAKMHSELWWSLADMAEAASFSKRRANRGSRGGGRSGEMAVDRRLRPRLLVERDGTEMIRKRNLPAAGSG